MLKEIGGKSYYICSFDLDIDSDYEVFIPREIDFSMILNREHPNKSAFLALMATEGMPTPTRPDRLAFTQETVMIEGQKSTLTFSNLLFMKMVKLGLEDKFGSSKFTLDEDKIPAHITMNGKISNIFDKGIDLTGVEVWAVDGRLHLVLHLLKEIPVIGDIHFTSTSKLFLTWDDEKEELGLKPDGDPEISHSVSQKWWEILLEIFGGLLYTIIIQIVLAIISHKLDDKGIGKTLNNMLESVKIPVELPGSLSILKFNAVNITDGGAFQVGITINL